jgi:hypothetical protein
MLVACVRINLFMLVLVGVSLASCNKRPDEITEDCLRTGGDGLQTEGLQVYRGSSLQGDDVELGEIPRCAASSKATRVYLLAHRVLQDVPADLRPAHVVIHVGPKLEAAAPPIHVAEVHRATKSILINADDVAKLDSSTLLHELAHLQMAAIHPAPGIASRLVASLEEGIADYYAATIGGSAVLGTGPAARNLNQRPVWLRGGWTKLGQPREPWSAQQQGWDLGALLWQHEKRPGPLLRDLISCMKEARIETGESVEDIVSAWLGTCPSRSQSLIDEFMHRWIPQAMY